MHLVNGVLADRISLTDRGVLYGHSVFETLAVHQRRALLQSEHLARLKKGCERLHIPYAIEPFAEDIRSLLNRYPESQFVIRLTQTAGDSGRGYSTPSTGSGTRIVSAFEWPKYPSDYWQQGIILGQVDLRLANQSLLAGIKHSNRLEQVLARAQWQESWQEAVLLNADGDVVEATQSNIFALHGDTLKTPVLDQQGVVGVMREKILDIAANALGLDCQLVRLSVDDLFAADEVFVSNSLIGLWPVNTFQSQHYSDFQAATQLLELLIEHDAIPPV